MKYTCKNGTEGPNCLV